MRLVLIVPLLLVILGGVLFGALNGMRVPLDFHFFNIDLPLGVALFGALSIGWLLGGLAAWSGAVSRLRRQVRTLRRDLQSVRASRSAAVDRDDT